MLDQLVFEFDNANSGRILRLPAPMYFTMAGWDWCHVGQSVGGMHVQWGAFFRFDTSAIPDHAEVTSVQFRSRGYYNNPLGEPDDWEWRWSIGDILGGSLDGTDAEWTAGTEVLTISDTAPADKTTLQFDSAANALVDKSGDTDVKIICHSAQGGGSASWSKNWNVSTTYRCKLYVFYTVPTAEVTGTGSASASATVTHDADATVTGSGDVEAAAGLLLATASATASGTGTGTADCGVIRVCSGTATGSGTVPSADPAMLYGGIATALGAGDATGAAVMVYYGTGTATGAGSSTASGGLMVAALALHMATIAISPVDDEEISIAPVHAASISIADEDEVELGPRRN